MDPTKDLHRSLQAACTKNKEESLGNDARGWPLVSTWTFANMNMYAHTHKSRAICFLPGRVKNYLFFNIIFFSTENELKKRVLKSVINVQSLGHDLC